MAFALVCGGLLCDVLNCFGVALNCFGLVWVAMACFGLLWLTLGVVFGSGLLWVASACGWLLCVAVGCAGWFLDFVFDPPLICLFFDLFWFSLDGV